MTVKRCQVGTAGERLNLFEMVRDLVEYLSQLRFLPSHVRKVLRIVMEKKRAANKPQLVAARVDIESQGDTIMSNQIQVGVLYEAVGVVVRDDNNKLKLDLRDDEHARYENRRNLAFINRRLERGDDLSDIAIADNPQQDAMAMLAQAVALQTRGDLLVQIVPNSMWIADDKS